MTQGPARIHRLKITLAGSEPPIWRQVEVPSDLTLADLHHIIQRAMGWWDSHLHAFEIDRTLYEQELDDDGGMDTVDEATVRLDQVAPEGTIFRYEYDFGDSWNHEIMVEAVADPEPGTTYPRCLAGERACPPEDCGGTPGYENLLAVIADPKHPEHDEMLEWVDDPFNPERFSMDEMNEAFAAFARARRG